MFLSVDSTATALQLPRPRRAHRAAPPCNLPACPAHHARTRPTAACAHHAHHCRSAPPCSTSTPPQALPAGDATPPAPASGDAEHCCVCLERLLPAAQGAQLPVPFPACSRNAFGVPGARSPECVLGAWSGLHDELLRVGCVVVACPCRGGSRAKPLLSKTTNSARLPPAMHPNFVRRQGSQCCAATGSRPWDAQTGRLRKAVPIRRDSGIAAWRPGWLCHGGPPGCPPSSCNRRRSVQPLRWRIVLGV